MSRNYGEEAAAAEAHIWEGINQNVCNDAANQASSNARHVQELQKQIADMRNKMRFDRQLIKNLLGRVQKLETTLKSVLERQQAKTDEHTEAKTDKHAETQTDEHAEEEEDEAE